MGLTSSLGKRPARLHSSMMGMRLSSMNLRVVSRTRRSSSVSRESNSRKSTPRNLMAITFLVSVSSPRSLPRISGRQSGRKLLKLTKGGGVVKRDSDLEGHEPQRHEGPRTKAPTLKPSRYFVSVVVDQVAGYCFLDRERGFL